MKTNTIAPHFRLFAATALAAFALNLGIAPAAELWTEDFAAAKETAAKEKKDLLIDFTGSDWCSWCVKLKEEVFSKPEFEAEAPKSFVLVELDYPQSKKQDEKIKKQNEELAQTYTIEGYPTILLTDAAGRAYAKTGYARGGPVPYLKQLAEFKATREKRDEAFAKAEKAEGLDKAKAIHEGLKALDPEIVDAYYSKEVEMVISLDKDDTLGLKKAHEASKAEEALQTKLEALHGEEKFDEFLKTIDEFITTNKLEGEAKQKMLMNKLAVYGPDKLDDAEKLVDEIIKIDAKTEAGQTAAQIKTQIGTMRAQSGGKGKGDKPADKEEEAEEAPAKPEKL